MYKYETNEDGNEFSYSILDPDGTTIATLTSLLETLALVSHLNR